MKSITNIIENELKLKVNRNKSNVDLVSRIKLIKFGIPKPKAYQYANTRKGYWRISNSPILNKIFNNKYFEILGLISMTKIYQVK